MGIIILSRASWTVNIASKHDTDQMPTFSGAVQSSPKNLERTEVCLDLVDTDLSFVTGMVIDYSITSEQGTLWV